MTRAVLVVLALLAACKRKDERPVDRDAAKKLFDEVPLQAPPGLSDLAIDDRGILWSVAERDHVVIEIDISKTPPAVVRHPIQGLHPQLESEGLALLGGGKMAIGVEGTLTPFAGVAYAELRGNDVVVTKMLPLGGTNGVNAEINHGIEAVCGNATELLAAGESPVTEHDRRWAPLLRIAGDTVTGAKLWLTTKKGKISALSCTIAADGTAQVTAIERHYGVCRVLTFTVTRDATEVTPTVDIDLWPLVHDNFNMEGVAHLPDGRMVIVNDNQSKEVLGPTELFVFHPR